MVTAKIKEILETQGKYFAKIEIGYQVKSWQIKEGQMYFGMVQKQVFLEHPNKRLVLDKFELYEILFQRLFQISVQIGW